MNRASSTTFIHGSTEIIPVMVGNQEDVGDDSHTQQEHLTVTGKQDDEFKPEKWGIRHLMVYTGNVGIILLVMMRINLSIAIVAMVGKAESTHINRTSTLLDDTCPVTVNSQNASYAKQEGEFDWDEKTQGYLLGAYFYGNFITNLIGGRVAEYVGGRLVFGLGILISSLFTIVSPIAARTSTNLFFTVRLLTGVAQGFVMPAVTRCMVTWIPPQERSKYNTIMYSGAELGTVAVLALGGWLCGLTSFGGWTLVFYIFGSLGILWTLLWLLLITERPESHPRITSEEKEYILTYCKVKRGKPIAVPWMAVMTSLPLWSVFIMHMGHNWGYYTLLTLLPSYLCNIQHFELKKNGLLSSLPYLCKWIFATIYGFYMNKLTQSNKISVLTLRRMSMIVGCYIPALGLVLLTFAGCNQVASVTILVISTTIKGTVFCGYFCSIQDLSPNLAGTLYGFSNFLANTTGFLAPATAGAILYNNQTLTAWNTVFYISALLYVISSTIYAIFISVDVQPFNEPKKQEEKHIDGEDENLKVWDR